MLDALAQADPDLRAAIARVGYPAPRQRDPGFGTLLRIILAQQVSTASAAALWRKLEAALGGDVTPASFLTLDDRALRACGFSARKVEYARGMCAAIAGRSPGPRGPGPAGGGSRHLGARGLRGFGRWSAEIYLLFALGRADVFPADDLAVQIAYQRLKRLDARPPAKALRDSDRAVAPLPRRRCGLPMALLRCRHLGRGMSWPRSVLITGAGSGLGLALAATLVARGSTVLGLVRRPESAAALLAATDDRAVAVQGDVTEPAVEDAIAAALARHRKPLDLLVNNAGAMAVGNTLGDLDPVEIVRLIDLHCNGALRCTRAALPALRLAERAMVVNVSSRLGLADPGVGRRVRCAAHLLCHADLEGRAQHGHRSALPGNWPRTGSPSTASTPAASGPGWQVRMPTSTRGRPLHRCCAVLGAMSTATATGRLLGHVSGQRLPW